MLFPGIVLLPGENIRPNIDSIKSLQSRVGGDWVLKIDVAIALHMDWNGTSSWGWCSDRQNKGFPIMSISYSSEPWICYTTCQKGIKVVHAIMFPKELILKW